MKFTKNILLEKKGKTEEDYSICKRKVIKKNLPNKCFKINKNDSSCFIFFQIVVKMRYIK